MVSARSLIWEKRDTWNVMYDVFPWTVLHVLWKQGFHSNPSDFASPHADIREYLLISCHARRVVWILGISCFNGSRNVYIRPYRGTHTDGGWFIAKLWQRAAQRATPPKDDISCQRAQGVFRFFFKCSWICTLNVNEREHPGITRCHL